VVVDAPTTTIYAADFNVKGQLMETNEDIHRHGGVLDYELDRNVINDYNSLGQIRVRQEETFHDGTNVTTTNTQTNTYDEEGRIIDSIDLNVTHGFLPTNMEDPLPEGIENLLQGGQQEGLPEGEYQREQLTHRYDIDYDPESGRERGYTEKVTSNENPDLTRITTRSNIDTDEVGQQGSWTDLIEETGKDMFNQFTTERLETTFELGRVDTFTEHTYQGTQQDPNGLLRITERLGTTYSLEHGLEVGYEQRLTEEGKVPPLNHIRTVTREEMDYNKDGQETTYTETTWDNNTPDIWETLNRSDVSYNNGFLSRYTETTHRESRNAANPVETTSIIEHDGFIFDQLGRIVQDTTWEKDIYGATFDHVHQQQFDGNGRIQETLDHQTRHKTDVVTRNHRFGITYTDQGDQKSYTETQHS
ncbi:hypothetical protein BVX98_03030, partial [bacterium F11]